MKTFFQYIESIKHKKFKKNRSTSAGFENILEDLSHEDIVKFALYCAEDCVDNNDDNTMIMAQRCINLVKEWLSGENKESLQQQLISVARWTSNDYVAAYSSAANAAYAAANSTAGTDESVIAAAQESAGNAADSFADNDGGIYNQKMREYLTYAQSLHSTNKGYNHYDFSNKLDFNDVNDIAVFLDYLEDNYQNHNLIEQLPNSELRFNLPQGYDIIAKNNIELANKIKNDKFAKSFLERMYKNK